MVWTQPSKFCPSTYNLHFHPYFIHSSLTQHVKQKGTAKWNDVGHWSLGGYPEMPRGHRIGSWLGWCWSIMGQGLMRLLTTTKKVTEEKTKQNFIPQSRTQSFFKTKAFRRSARWYSGSWCMLCKSRDLSSIPRTHKNVEIERTISSILFSDVHTPGTRVHIQHTAPLDLLLSHPLIIQNKTSTFSQPSLTGLWLFLRC